MTKKQEVWKDLSGYEGLYQVSNLGNVLSVRRGIILKHKLDKDGYKEYSLVNKFGKRKSERGHRIVALMFCEKPIGYNVVNHKNMIKGDNNCDNLEWSTVSLNTKHAYHNSEKIRESTTAASKLGADAIRIKIEVFKDGVFVGTFDGKANCAEELGISEKTIYNRLNGKFSSRSGYTFKKVGD